MLRMYQRIPFAVAAATIAVAQAFASDAWYPNTAEISVPNATYNVIGDASASGTAITNNGATIIPSMGKNTVAYFNGTSYVELSYNTDYNIGSNDATFEAILYWDGTMPNGTITLWGQTDGTNNNMLVQITAYDGTVIFSTERNAIATTANIKFPAKRPVHVAYVKLGPKYLFYIDGVFAGTVIGNSTLPTLMTSFMVGSSNGTANFLSGYLSQFRLTVGVGRYNSDSFKPPTSLDLSESDPYWSNVKIALQFNNSGPVEKKAHTVTNHGAVVCPTANLVNDIIKTGGTSSTTASIASNAFLAFGANDAFTLEMLCSIPALPSSGVYTLLGSAVSGGLTVNLTPTGITVGQSGSTVNNTFTTAVPTNTPFALTLQRKSGLISLFINGTLIGTAQANTVVYAQGLIGIGYNANTSSNYCSYYLCGLRVTKGIARYSGNYNVNFQDFGDNRNYDYYWDSTKVLIKTNDGVIADFKGNPIVATNVTVDPNFTINGKQAMVLDGTGYITIPDVAGGALNPGSQDFTIELEVVPTDMSTADTYVCKRTDANATNGFALFKVAGSTQLKLYLSSVAGSWDLAAGVAVGNLIVNQVNYITVSRIGSTFYTSINGVAGGSVTSSAAVYSNTGSLYVGGDASGVNTVTGYLGEFRYTVGVGRYNKAPAIKNSEFPYFSHAGKNYDNVLNNVVMSIPGTALSSAINNSNVAFGSSVIVDSTVKRFNNNTLKFIASTQSYVRYTHTSAIGTRNFGVDIDFNASDLTGDRVIFDNRTATLAGMSVCVSAGGDKKISIWNNSARIATGTTTLATGVDYRFSMNRFNGTTYVFLNGVLELSFTDATNYASTYQYFGANYNYAQNFVGNLSNMRFVFGVPSKLNKHSVTGPYLSVNDGPSSDPFWNYTTFLLDTSTMTDRSSKARKITIGGATIDNKNLVNGVPSGYFNGNSYLTCGSNADMLFGTGDFSIDAFVCPYGAGAIYGYGIAGTYNSGAGNGWGFEINRTTSTVCGIMFYLISGGTAYSITYSSSLPSFVMTHVAVFRINGVCYLALNGTVVATATITANDNYVNSLYVGTGNSVDLGASAHSFYGNIAQVRICVGASRFKGGFTPPAYKPALTA